MPLTEQQLAKLGTMMTDIDHERGNFERARRDMDGLLAFHERMASNAEINAILEDIQQRAELSLKTMTSMISGEPPA